MPQTTDHRVTLESALEEVEPFKQWMIGANLQGSVDGILDRGVNPKTTPQSFYNLKSLNRKRFLQKEHQTIGINIGFSNDASARTAETRAHWGFFPQSASGLERADINGLRRSPIVFGEIVAIAWWPPRRSRYSEFSLADGANVPEFLTARKQTLGPNLEWSQKGASYEWVILGGAPGTVVRRGEDSIILYNFRRQRALVRAVRFEKGANVGLSNELSGTKPELAVWQILMLQPARDITN